MSRRRSLLSPGEMPLQMPLQTEVLSPLVPVLVLAVPLLFLVVPAPYVMAVLMSFLAMLLELWRVIRSVQRWEAQSPVRPWPWRQAGTR